VAENDEQKKAPEAGQVETQPEQPRVWKCGRCKCDLVTKKVELDYMGYSISHELPACPKCGKAPGGGKFCQECGAPLARTKACPKCKAEMPAGAKFCPECGTPA